MLLDSIVVFLSPYAMVPQSFDRLGHL